MTDRVYYLEFNYPDDINFRYVSGVELGFQPDYPGTLPFVFSELAVNEQEEGKPPKPEYDVSVLTFEDWKLAAVKAALLFGEYLGNQVLAQYTTAERQSWPEKIQEARQFTTGVLAEDQCLILSGEAKARGITIEKLAPLILTKAAEFSVLIGALTGYRAKVKASIEATKTVPELLSVVSKSAQQAQLILQDPTAEI